MTVLSFDFFDHTFNEALGLVKTRPFGVSLVEDRFGNEKSAVFINGHQNSYLNLGTKSILKAKKTTISLWVYLNRLIYSGQGDFCNPIFLVKNGPGNDFYVAYNIAFGNDRFSATASKDSIKEAIITGVNKAEFTHWYHLLITSDNTHFAFYINGNLQARCRKDFETTFLASDSAAFLIQGLLEVTKHLGRFHVLICGSMWIFFPLQSI